MNSISRIQNFEYTLNEVFNMKAEVVKSNNPSFNRFQHVVTIINNRPTMSSYDMHQVAEAALIENCSAMYVGTEEIKRKHATTFRHLFEVRPRFLPFWDDDNAMVRNYCQASPSVQLAADRTQGAFFEQNILTIGNECFTLVMRAPLSNCHQYQLRLSDTYHNIATFDTAAELLLWIEREFDIPVTTAVNR